jgi:hypothetical protein
MTMSDQHGEGCGVSVGVPCSCATRRLRRRSLNDVKIVPTRYLWQDYLPAGQLALLVGKPGVGKSTVAADLAANLTTGRLAGDFLRTPRNVLYSVTEDAEYVLKARIVAAGGDPGRLDLVDVVHGDSDGSPLLVSVELDALREEIRKRRPGLVVLDALNSSLDGQHNDNSNIRPQLEKLKALAHQTGTAILGIAHFRKSTAGSEPLDAIGGAGAYGQVVRHALGCARDEEEGVCSLSVIKTNVQGLGVGSLAYQVDEAQVPSDAGGTTSVGRVTWLGESEVSVRDLLQRLPQGEEDRSEREQVVDWLVDYLVSQGGQARALDVFKAGQSEGYSRDTLKRSKGRRVRSEKAGFGGGWVWRLLVERAEESTKSAKGAGLSAPLPSLPSSLPWAGEGGAGDAATLASSPTGAQFWMPSQDDKDCGHSSGIRAQNGKCPLCIAARHARPSVHACRACNQPLDAAVGSDVHPGCEVA